MAGGRVRIIAGRWRGRRLTIMGGAGVRPTPDRVRETLFNWLAPDLPGARCLDLFAGSGALGFEAVSRGAALSVLVDRDRSVCSRLALERERLGAGEAIRVVEADALDWLVRPAAARTPAAAPAPFDVVFVDPPYPLDVHSEVLAALHGCAWLAPGARVYLEVVRRRSPPGLPAGWTITRSGRAGEVRYHLASPDSGDSRGAQEP